MKVLVEKDGPVTRFASGAGRHGSFERIDEGIPGWIEKGYPTAGTEPAAKIERHE